MKKMKRYTLKRDRGKVAGKSWWWYIYIRGGREFEIIQPGEISSKKRPPRLWHCQDIWRGIVLHQTQFWKWSFFLGFWFWHWLCFCTLTVRVNHVEYVMNYGCLLNYQGVLSTGKLFSEIENFQISTNRNDWRSQGRVSIISNLSLWQWFWNNQMRPSITVSLISW